MKRHTTGLDFSIRGDELEQHRIQLEHNLQHTDLSYRLSSVSEDEYNDNDSIEYPRHNSGPAVFPSFEIPSRDHFDGETHSQIHPWSYRTVDDEEGINPYAGGETMSTAAHHASALTLSAGLGGGRAGRRDISFSGAEYDPDRPLHDMIAGVDSKLSVFDMEPSRSKYPGVGSVTFDPLVVDSTAELDRVLQSGYAPAAQIQSPLPSSSSSSASDSDAHPYPASRPRLSDALRRVSFSPKRPRSNAGSPCASPRPLPNIHGSNSEAMPTPKPKKRTTNIFPSYPTPQPQQQPHVRLHPPTPSSSGSQFSKMARGITREIERAAQNDGSHSRNTERNPFDTSAHTNTNNTSVRQPTPKKAPSAMKRRTQTHAHMPMPWGKVQLPDVTGLTSAVESPAKMGAEYYAYRVENGSPRENEARLMGMLNSLQAKLQHLEEENGISRRRVRELELELDVCKQDVTRERTRAMQREDVVVQQQHDANLSGAGRRNKGKARARDTSLGADREVLGERYREAVEEKKALEALITTLRTHLTRLTAELSSHRELLAELRELRDSDVRALQQKGAEIERLREEVERLAGEVEVLRGVVEEGLKERRSGGEVSGVHRSRADTAMSLDGDDEDNAGDVGEDVAMHNGEEGNDEDGAVPEPFDPASILGSSRNENANAGTRLGDRTTTTRTDYATLGSSHLPQSSQPTSGHFIDSAEFERISAEVEERRSIERSGSESAGHVSTPTRLRYRATVQEASDEDDNLDPHGEDSHRQDSPGRSMAAASQHQSIRAPHAQAALSGRAVAPTTNHQQRQTRRPQAHPTNPADETPFPQIRGTHLERLFFSAPEHNTKTCGVCHRRRRASVDENAETSWIPSRFRDQRADEEEDDDDDEGFAEGSEQPEDRQGKREGERVTFSKEPSSWRMRAQREGPPPQTVIARIIRELEDDFTHYKGIYIELADQYKDMDAVSDVPRRNILAKHLKEVVNILEQKGDQIASLYDLLSFKDKPVAESVVPSRSIKARTASTIAVASSSIGRSAGPGSRRHPIVSV